MQFQCLPAPLPVNLQGVLAEQVDMLAPVRSYPGQHLIGNFKALSPQTPDDLCHAVDVVQYHEVGNQMVVVDHFVLLMPQVLLDLTVIEEEQPFDKIIEGLALAGSGLDSLPHLYIRDVLQ